MIFTRKTLSNSHSNQQISNTPHSVATQRTPKPSPTTVASAAPVLPKMVWGRYFWEYFHTLAEKIKDEHFNDAKSELLNYIKRICANLPCPDCAAHAIQIISKLTPDQIASKQNFKIFLMQFHNSVNIRTGKRLFTIEELNAKYSRANVLVVVPYFIKVYSYRNTNVRLLVNSFQKDMLIKDFIKWIRENIHKFDK
jgi:hypothetical protein